MFHPRLVLVRIDYILYLYILATSDARIGVVVTSYTFATSRARTGSDLWIKFQDSTPYRPHNWTPRRHRALLERMFVVDSRRRLFDAITFFSGSLSCELVIVLCLHVSRNYWRCGTVKANADKYQNQI